MTVFPILIDAPPAYLRLNGSAQSLLLAPVGMRSILAHARDHVAAVADEPLTIVTTLAADDAYEARLRRSGAVIGDVVPIDGFGELLTRLEPSDWLLIVDPRWFTVESGAFRRLARKLDASWEVRHLVALEKSRRGTKEYVHLDEEGRVLRIQRYYDGVTWRRARAVAASLIPVSAARGVPVAAFRALAALREALVANGVVSQDVELQTGVFDLNQEQGLLQLCEHSLRELRSGPLPAGYDMHAPDVWMGPRCSIGSGTRLSGPIILHEDADIGPDVRMIGPVVVGAGGHVGRNAVLAQCLVLPDTTVPERTTAHCRVLGNGHGNGPTPAIEDTHGSVPSDLAEWPGVVIDEDRPSKGNGQWRRESYVGIKRVVEGFAALFGLIVLSPLLLATAAAIKLTSRGPVFFYHEREGRNGKPFRCCKFRTMVADAHRQQRALYSENAVDGPQFDLRDDPRITWLGRWLRLTNIDELPQLFHVVLGQMSLIGPRPSPFRENQICVPWREARLAVRPGITGLWQLCRQDRSAGDFHQWIYYDMLYVRHLSFALDLKILVATLLTLAGRWSVPVTRLIPARKLRDA